MKKIVLPLCVGLLFNAALFAQNQVESAGFRQEGMASWYGAEFEGRPTASGEVFNPNDFTAAHPELPMGTVVVVTNLVNNQHVTVRINDRGPFVRNRIIDVSRAAAEKLDMLNTGTAQVLVEVAPRGSAAAPEAAASTQTAASSPIPASEQADPAVPQTSRPNQTFAAEPSFTTMAQPPQPVAQQPVPAQATVPRQPAPFPSEQASAQRQPTVQQPVPVQAAVPRQPAPPATAQVPAQRQPAAQQPVPAQATAPRQPAPPATAQAPAQRQPAAQQPVPVPAAAPRQPAASRAQTAAGQGDSTPQIRTPAPAYGYSVQDPAVARPASPPPMPKANPENYIEKPAANRTPAVNTPPQTAPALQAGPPPATGQAEAVRPAVPPAAAQQSAPPSAAAPAALANPVSPQIQPVAAAPRPPAAPPVNLPQMPETARAPAQNAAPAGTGAPAPAVSYPKAEITGAAIIPGRAYRLQIGSFKVAKNAVEVFDRLQAAGLNPQWEPYENYYRVVLTHVRAENIPHVATRLGSAGFREVIAREER
ncbi:MAG: septal ring lytic transglycosylase RlpA family protein [Spirochaetaceae bacterium]|jgi:rare lipoprotein A|nr:septal ring lytic transglycosylase RlpA family protein [Spirochaetaceae bacterium]